MAKRPNDDLFASTTMTFGEHLEELRACLVKALLGLVVGVGIGMFAAGEVVKWIQLPLASAIERYYVSSTIDKLKLQYPGIPEEFLQFMAEKKLTFEDVYFEKPQLERMLNAATPLAKINGRSTNQPLAASQNPLHSEPEPATTSSASDRTSGASFSFQTLGPPSSELINTRIWKPMRIEITSLNPQEVFMIWMKASIVAGTILASPWIFFQIWNFVAAGLYPHEKNYVYLYMPFSIGLFVAGVATAFFFVFEPVLDFLFSFNKQMSISPEPRISEWLSFVLLLPLGFGISFQLPLVMLFVHRIGIVQTQAYIDKWRIAILAIFVISSVLTPADPISLLFMAVPLTFLYFLGIGLCQWMPRNRNPYEGLEVE